MLRRLSPLLFALLLGAAACKSSGNAASASAAATDEVAAAECPAFTANGRLPATLDEVAAQRAKGASWSNKEIRARYVCWATGIGAENAKWKAEGLAAEERAKRAFQTRHDARIIARSMMASEVEVKALEQRDRDKYGTPDGPSFDWLVKHAREKGLEGDALYENIIESSQRTDPATNKALGVGN